MSTSLASKRNITQTRQPALSSQREPIGASLVEEVAVRVDQWMRANHADITATISDIQSFIATFFPHQDFRREYLSVADFKTSRIRREAHPSWFWEVVSPIAGRLLDQSIADAAWCAIGVRLQPPHSIPSLAGALMRYAFYASDRVLPPDAGRSAQSTVAKQQRRRWRALQLAEFLGERRLMPPFQILTTSDLVLNVLQQDIPLIVVAQESDQSISLPDDVDRLCVLDCRDLVERARCSSHANEIQRRMLEAAELALEDRQAPFQTIDSLHTEMLSELPAGYEVPVLVRLRSTPKADTVQLQAAVSSAIRQNNISHPYLPLLKYLSLMTAVHPAWSRITMIPVPGSVSAFARPGTLVVCEDHHGSDPGKRLNQHALEHVGRIPTLALALRVGMAPLATLRAAVEGSPAWQRGILPLGHNFRAVQATIATHEVLEHYRAHTIEEVVDDVRSRLKLHSIFMSELAAAMSSVSADKDVPSIVCNDLCLALRGILNVRFTPPSFEVFQPTDRWSAGAGAVLVELVLNALKHSPESMPPHARELTLTISREESTEGVIGLFRIENRAVDTKIAGLISSLRPRDVRQLQDGWVTGRVQGILKTGHGLELCQDLLQSISGVLDVSYNTTLARIAITAHIPLMRADGEDNR